MRRQASKKARLCTFLGSAPPAAPHIYIYMAFRNFSQGSAPPSAPHIYIYGVSLFFDLRRHMRRIYIYIYICDLEADFVTSPAFHHFGNMQWFMRVAI